MSSMSSFNFVHKRSVILNRNASSLHARSLNSLECTLRLVVLLYAIHTVTSGRILREYMGIGAGPGMLEYSM